MRFARRSAVTALALAAAVATFGPTALAVETAERGGRWLLVAPPPIPEKRALIKIYTTSSDLRSSRPNSRTVSNIPTRGSPSVASSRSYGRLAS